MSGSSMPGGDPCVYVTQGWGIHDDRWVQGLVDLGFAPTTVALGRDVDDAAELRSAVLAAAGVDTPVLAGPLTSVTRELIDLPRRLIGMSWGYDLDEIATTEDPAPWLARLDGLVVDSWSNHEAAAGRGLSTDRICFLPWGLDLARWPFVDRSSQHVTADPVVLTLRAHEPRYRVADVITAFAAVSLPAREPRLLVGHGGSLTPTLRDLAARLGIEQRVEFIGTVEESDLPRLLSQADCYVSAAETDGTSVTLLQAMATGTPVVVSDTAGNRGWVEEGRSGWLFPVGDVQALSGALTDVLSDFPAVQVRAARAQVDRDADWRANLPRLGALLRFG